MVLDVKSILDSIKPLSEYDRKNFAVGIINKALLGGIGFRYHIKMEKVAVLVAI
jgi:hypothetical protein